MADETATEERSGSFLIPLETHNPDGNIGVDTFQIDIADNIAVVVWAETGQEWVVPVPMDDECPLTPLMAARILADALLSWDVACYTNSYAEQLTHPAVKNVASEEETAG